MNERKSEKMVPLKRLVWKLTIAQIFMFLVACLAIRHEGINVASDIIHKSFRSKNAAKGDDLV